MNEFIITGRTPDTRPYANLARRHFKRRLTTYFPNKSRYIVSLISGLIAFCHTTLAEESFRILLTNDDGIEAPGIQALAEELGKTYEILVCAPAENQSGSGSTSTLRPRGRDSNELRPRQITLKKWTLTGAHQSFAIEGAPSDAVRFGLRVFGKEKPVDLVVSGINGGENIGGRARTSGTIGAAFTGLAAGIPSIAFSADQSITSYTQAAQFAAKIVNKVKERSLPKDVLLSVNIPGGEIKGVIAAPMALGDRRRAPRTEPTFTAEGDLIFQLPQRPGSRRRNRDDSQARGPRDERASEDRISRTDNRGRARRQAPPEPGNNDDYYFRAENLITITPLKLDWTDYEIITDLNFWNLQFKDEETIKE